MSEPAASSQPPTKRRRLIRQPAPTQHTRQVSVQPELFRFNGKECHNLRVSAPACFNSQDGLDMTDTAVQTPNPVSTHDVAIQASPAELDQVNWFLRINSPRFEKWVQKVILDAWVIRASNVRHLPSPIHSPDPSQDGSLPSGSSSISAVSQE